MVIHHKMGKAALKTGVNKARGWRAAAYAGVADPTMSTTGARPYPSQCLQRSPRGQFRKGLGWAVQPRLID